MRCWPLAPALICAIACAGHPTNVARVVDAKVSEGRFVSHVSYAAYARAAQLEAEGDLVGAEAAYQEALRYDPQSPQIWTRLGAVRCASRPQDASAAFETSLRIDPDYAPLWYEQARCYLQRDNPSAALEAVQRAMKLDPEHVETSQLMAEVLVALKRPEDAQRYLNALAARYPELSVAGRARSHQDTEQPETEERSSERAATQGAQRSTLQALDQALLAGDMKSARQHGLELDLSLSEIAARAILLGRALSALEQAREVSAADPENAAAWVIQLAASDLTRNEAAFESILATPPSTPEPLGSGSRLLFAELLKRRVSAQAARAFLKATRPSFADKRAPHNALLSEHQERLERELSKP
jgi:tetratricopeptide (TPR) repeat protein